MSDGDEAFLSRWSRRKLEAQRAKEPRDLESAAGEPAVVTAATAHAADRAAEGRRAADDPKRMLGEADFADVDFDKLDASSDYTRFMQANVPDRIRHRALSKLWVSDPVLSRIDELHDYHGDYTDAAVAVTGALKTAHRVGRGFLTDEEVAAWDRLGKPEKAKPEVAGAGVVVAEETPDQPEVAAFLDTSTAYATDLYPAESNHLVDLSQLAAANARFMVARRDNVALGCGALILAGDGSAELKRMWVAPTARGLGVGRRILDALETAARAAAVEVVRLETGIRQPEALGLYRRAGYAERAPFGDYRADPLSIFMEKRLA